MSQPLAPDTQAVWESARKVFPHGQPVSHAFPSPAGHCHRFLQIQPHLVVEPALTRLGGHRPLHLTSRSNAVLRCLPTDTGVSTFGANTLPLIITKVFTFLPLGFCLSFLISIPATELQSYLVLVSPRALSHPYPRGLSLPIPLGFLMPLGSCSDWVDHPEPQVSCLPTF